MSIKEIFLLITLFFSRNANKNVEMEKLKTSTDEGQSTEEVFCDLQSGDSTQNFEEEIVAKDIISENIGGDSIENSRIREFLANKKLRIGAATTFVALASVAGIGLKLHQNKKNKEEEQWKEAEERQLRYELERQQEEAREIVEAEKIQLREADKRRKRESARRRQQKNLDAELGDYWRL